MNKKKLLSIVLAMIFALTIAVVSVPQAEAATALKDINGHWAQVQILDMVNKGVISGYPDGSFKPENPITRAEFMSMINRAFAFTGSGTAQFSDVKSTDWFAPEVAKAVAAGYISGYPDGTMKPNAKVSRQEAAVMIAKAAKLDLTAVADLSKFSDAASIAAWSKTYIAACVKASFLGGYPDGTLKVGNNVKRAEAAAIVANTLITPPAAVYAKAGTYGPATGATTIDGNVVISAADVILQNTIITGDLTIDQSVGEGNVTLKGVTVKGTTIINGGGAHSINVDGSNLGNVVSNKAGVHISCVNGTTIVSVTLDSGATVDVAAGSTVEGVTVSTDGAVTLNGKFASVTVKGANPNVTVASGVIESLTIDASVTKAAINITSSAAVTNLLVNAPATVTGTGKITNATVTSAGVTIVSTPDNTIVAYGIQASIGGKIIIGTAKNLPTQGASTGGGGGPSGPSGPTETDYTQAGTYGPASGTTTLTGNVVISAADVILQNTVVTGNLTIAASVDNGTVTLKNVTVQGTTTINGGGSHSINSDNCVLNNVVVNKDGIHIDCTGDTTIKSVTLNGKTTFSTTDGVIVGEITVSTSGEITLSGHFASLEIDDQNANVTIADGKVDSVIIDATATSSSVNIASGAVVTSLTTNAPGSEISLATGATLTNLTANAAADVTGTGTITNATINAASVTIAETPTNKPTVAPGITATVGGTTVSGDVTVAAVKVTMLGATQTVASNAVAFDLSKPMIADSTAVSQLTITTTPSAAIAGAALTISQIHARGIDFLSSSITSSIPSSGVVTVSQILGALAKDGDVSLGSLRTVLGSGDVVVTGTLSKSGYVFNSNNAMTITITLGAGGTGTISNAYFTIKKTGSKTAEVAITTLGAKKTVGDLSSGSEIDFVTVIASFVGGAGTTTTDFKNALEHLNSAAIDSLPLGKLIKKSVTFDGYTVNFVAA